MYFSELAILKFQIAAAALMGWDYLTPKSWRDYLDRGMGRYLGGVQQKVDTTLFIMVSCSCKLGENSRFHGRAAACLRCFEDRGPSCASRQRRDRIAFGVALSLLHYKRLLVSMDLVASAHPASLRGPGFSGSDYLLDENRKRTNGRLRLSLPLDIIWYAIREPSCNIASAAADRREDAAPAEARRYAAEKP